MEVCLSIYKMELLLDECNYCHIKSDHIKKCGRCKSVAYCSREHQTLDWKERGYKNICKDLACRKKANNEMMAKTYREFIQSLPVTDSSADSEKM